MNRIVLISCVKRKANYRCKAEHMYQSELFKKCLKYGRSRIPHKVLILSAKHGVLELDDEIEPYDETLNRMPIADVKKWADRVLKQLQSICDVSNHEFVILASDRYRRFIVPHLARYEIPMEGLRIGQQLQFLKEKAV